MNQELISIIVPIYDIEDCLPRCIESLMAQTYENIEILLINDGSSDNSGAICEAYTQRDPRVKYFYKPNGGLSSARNFGLDQAQGEYICFVDGDDFMDKRMVEILYSEIRKHHVKLSACGFLVYHDGDELQEITFDPENQRSRGYCLAPAAAP